MATLPPATTRYVHTDVMPSNGPDDLWHVRVTGANGLTALQFRLSTPTNVRPADVYDLINDAIAELSNAVSGKRDLLVRVDQSERWTNG